MLILIALGVTALVAAAITALLGASSAAIVLAIIGVAALLVALIRRFGRKGDFSRSGWTGF